MSGGDYIEGLLYLVPTLGAVGGGSWLLLGRRYPELTGSARLTALAMLATLGLLAVHLAPALLGVLARGSVLIGAALWLAGAALARPAAAPPSPAPAPVRDSARAEWVLAGLAAAALAAFAIALGRSELTVPIPTNDALTFHLPGVAAWIESGSIWQIDVFLADVAPGHYPNNGDLVLLAGVLPWHNDFLAHFLIWPFWIATGLATYALARELGSARAVAVLVACALLAIPAVSQPALTGMLVDSLMLFGLATGLLFLVRHHRSGRTSELVLAGLALGVSFGTKWYGVSTVLALVAVWAVARYLSTRSLVTVGRQLAAMAGLVAAGGGIWLLRNLIVSGNPVFPVEVSPLGLTIFDAPHDPIREAFGFTIAHYLFDAGVLRDYIWPQLRDALALPTVALLAGAAGAGVAAFVARRKGVVVRIATADTREAVMVGVGLVVLFAAIYAITPYSAGGPEGLPYVTGADARYGIPALMVAAPLAAWAASLSRAGGIIFGALCLVGVLQGCRVVADGTVGSLDLGAGELAVGLSVAGIVGGAGYCFWRLCAQIRAADGDGWVRVSVVGLALAALLGIAIGGYEIQKSFNEKRYLGRDAAIDWVLVNAEDDTSVGLAGVWASEGIPPVWPAFGRRLGNEVSYVGNFADDVYRRFRDRERFVEALSEGDYDALIVGRGRVPQAAPTAEERWTRSAGFTRVAQSERLTVFAR